MPRQNGKGLEERVSIRVEFAEDAEWQQDGALVSGYLLDLVKRRYWDTSMIHHSHSELLTVAGKAWCLLGYRMICLLIGPVPFHEASLLSQSLVGEGWLSS